MTDQEFIDWLRFWLADLPVTSISDANLTLLLSSVKSAYPSATDCQIKYYFAIATLEWLVRASAKGSAGSAGSGEVKSRTEKTGAVSVTTDYDVGTSSGISTGWDRVLEDLKDNPDSIGCDVFPDITGSSKSSSVIFGGVSQSEYDKVRNNSDSRNGWNTSSPFRDSLYKRNY